MRKLDSKRIADGINKLVEQEGSKDAALTHLWFERHVAVKSIKEVQSLVYALLNLFDEVENGLSKDQEKILDSIDDRCNSWNENE